MVRLTSFAFSFFFTLSLFASEVHLFDGIGENAKESFSGVNLALHLGAVASTWVLVKSGVDAKVYDHFKHTPNDAAWPGAIVASGAGALGAGWYLYSRGRDHEDQELKGAAFVIAQASLITITYVTFLKSLTGRAHPTNTSALSSQEQSEQFEFGFRRWGFGYGWPSGHMSHTVAVTSALAYYLPHQSWLKWFSVGLSSYMLFTVSAFHSGQMHWFSDGVAGGLMGYAIGKSVGRGFRKQVHGATEQSSEVNLLPFWVRGYSGLGVALSF